MCNVSQKMYCQISPLFICRMMVVKFQHILAIKRQNYICVYIYYLSISKKPTLVLEDRLLRYSITQSIAFGSENFRQLAAFTLIFFLFKHKLYSFPLCLTELSKEIDSVGSGYCSSCFGEVEEGRVVGVGLLSIRQLEPVCGMP